MTQCHPDITPGNGRTGRNRKASHRLDPLHRSRPHIVHPVLTMIHPDFTIRRTLRDLERNLGAIRVKRREASHRIRRRFHLQIDECGLLTDVPGHSPRYPRLLTGTFGNLQRLAAVESLTHSGHFRIAGKKLPTRLDSQAHGLTGNPLRGFEIDERQPREQLICGKRKVHKNRQGITKHSIHSGVAVSRRLGPSANKFSENDCYCFSRLRQTLFVDEIPYKLPLHFTMQA
jgi:hypothetical protein